MNYAMFAFAAFINALITCGVLLFIMKKAVKTRVRYPITFVLYVLMAYMMTTTEWNGIFSDGFKNTDMLRFLLYISSAACICTALFILNWYQEKNKAKQAEGSTKLK